MASACSAAAFLWPASRAAAASFFARCSSCLGSLADAVEVGGDPPAGGGEFGLGLASPWIAASTIARRRCLVGGPGLAVGLGGLLEQALARPGVLGVDLGVVRGARLVRRRPRPRPARRPAGAARGGTARSRARTSGSAGSESGGVNVLAGRGSRECHAARSTCSQCLTPVGTVAANLVEHLGELLHADDRRVDGGIERGEIPLLEPRLGPSRSRSTR